MKTIVTQIEQTEKEIAKCESRLDAIERLGRLTHMTDEDWKKLEQEKTTLEQQLVDSRKTLKGLRWENWKSMIVSVILLGMVYLAYLLIYQPSSGEAQAQAR